jgi:hypothetical protein
MLSELRNSLFAIFLTLVLIYAPVTSGHEHVPDEGKWPTAAPGGNPYVKDIATITTMMPETYTVVAGKVSHG